jgi:hypothetical protein
MERWFDIFSRKKTPAKIKTKQNKNKTEQK